MRFLGGGLTFFLSQKCLWRIFWWKNFEFFFWKTWPFFEKIVKNRTKLRPKFYVFKIFDKKSLSKSCPLYNKFETWRQESEAAFKDDWYNFKEDNDDSLKAIINDRKEELQLDSVSTATDKEKQNKKKTPQQDDFEKI